MLCHSVSRLLSRDPLCLAGSRQPLFAPAVRSKSAGVLFRTLKAVHCWAYQMMSTLSPAAGRNTTIYDFAVKDIDGNDVSLQKYNGRVCLIVNVASKCGFTRQYAGLQELHDRYHRQGLSVLAFPCNQFGSQEPASEEEIKKFTSQKYNVTFDLFKKVDVNGSSASPLWTFLRSDQHGYESDDIQWNFSKFLVNRQGRPVKRYGPGDKPASLISAIEEHLEKPQAKL